MSWSGLFIVEPFLVGWMLAAAGYGLRQRFTHEMLWANGLFLGFSLHLLHALRWL